VRHSYPRAIHAVRSIWNLSPIVLIALLGFVLARQAMPAGAAAGVAKQVAAPPPLQVLAAFPATGLPSGPARIRAVVVHVPAGISFKHVHGGNVYNYMIAGSLQSKDDRGTHTYGQGQFFWEPVGHVHTVITTQAATFFSLQVLSPRAIDTIPVP
jgi:quercetin dioxygenase-like cupin family protein